MGWYKSHTIVWIVPLIGILIVSAGMVSAEDTNWWVKTFQGDIGDDADAVAISSSGDIIVAGTVNNALWVVDFDANGDVKWQKTYNLNVLNKATSIAVADNGDILVAGWTQGLEAEDVNFWLLRLDSQGNVIWQKTYGGDDEDYAYAIAMLS